MRSLFLFFIGWMMALTGHSQDILVPAEAQSFILDGYEPLDYVTGDLNGDKKMDAILVLHAPGEDSLDYDASPVRPLLLLIRQANGKLKQVERNDRAIMCVKCGGVFGDPYNGIEIAKNGFTLHFYGGSNWRWNYDYRFSYKPLAKTWQLTRESQGSYHTSDPNKVKETVIDEAELGTLPIGKFDSNLEYQESTWKVIAAKTFFFDQPKLGSRPRKGYLVKGNQATVIRVLTHFVEVSYTNANEEITTGFLLKKDLQPK